MYDRDESEDLGAIFDIFGKSGGFDNNLVNGYNLGHSYGNSHSSCDSGVCELEISDEAEFVGEIEKEEELEITKELEVDGELEHEFETEVDLDGEITMELENPDELEVYGELENELEIEHQDGFEVGGDIEIEQKFTSRDSSGHRSNGIPSGWGGGGMPSNPFKNGMFGGFGGFGGW